MNKIIKTDFISEELERVDEIEAGTTHRQVKDCINEIKTELIKDRELVALCAPQIGKPLRLFVVKTSDRNYKEFLNPMIITTEGMHLSFETNASLPGKTYIIPRADKVHVAYQGHDGRVDSQTFTGAYGEIVQQMIEMLDGILLSDYGLDLDDVGGVKAFNRATQKDKAAVIQMYLENLKLDASSIKTEIEDTPSLKQINDTIEFEKGLLEGTIQPLDEKGNVVDLYKKEEIK